MDDASKTHDSDDMADPAVNRGLDEEGHAHSMIRGPVFLVSAGLILAFVVLTVLFADQADAIFGAVQDWIVATVGWFYSLAVAIFLVFAIYIAMSRFGQIKLGPDDAEPEFGFVSWFAMLFSAGMGIGLMFYGVAEPVLHYSQPPTGEGGTVDAAREALSLTLFHWGVHAWAIYVVVGMAIAYFSFRHGLPLTIRSSLYPIIGERIHGPVGHAVDVFAVIGTMFGVATSLGLGVMQVNAGLDYLFGVGQGVGVQFILIGCITAVATISVVSGLGKGIRRLSELNIILALFLLVFVLFAGPTEFLLQATLQNTGNYLGSVIPRTFNLYAYEPNEWIGGWTLFYWGWWISWAPFVGMFIARVSRGRTIRQFVLGVLSVPVALTCLWFTVFGNTAIAMDPGLGGALSAAVIDSVPTALFMFLEQLPWAGLISLIATLLVVTFFVTSSDSGSLVIDMITSGGMADPPVWSRVFWAVTEGVVAAILLLAGGLGALQTAAIASGFPFAVIMLFICFGLWKGLNIDASVRRAAAPRTSPAGHAMPWQQRVKQILTYPDRKQAGAFLENTVRPALEAVGEEIHRAAGFEVDVRDGDEAMTLVVSHGEETDFLYEVRVRAYRRPSFAFPEFTFKDDRGGGGDSYFRAEVRLLEGAQHYDILGYSKDQVIADVLAQYDVHMNLLHLATPGAAQGDAA